MPVGEMLIYLGCVGYCGLYICNRWRGKDAHFGVTRIEPTSPKQLKVLTDTIVGAALAGFVVTGLWKLLFVYAAN